MDTMKTIQGLLVLFGFAVNATEPRMWNAVDFYRQFWQYAGWKSL